MSDLVPTPQFEEEIRAAITVPQANEKFVKSLHNRLVQQAASQRKINRPFYLRPAWVITYIVFLVMIITTLVIGPQKVYADFLKLFGYVPGIGFVDLNQVRVLQNGVTQRHADQEVTAVRGLISPYGTDIWLEFNDEARPVADAWLETADGQRFTLLNWSYDPDKSGTHGVVMHFATLPESVNEVTLRLVEGWSLPLVWVQGSTGSIKPANIVLAPTEALAETSIPAPSLCSQALGVQFCIQAAVDTVDGLQVLLESTSGGQYTTGSGFSPSMFDFPGKKSAITLTTSDGHVYPVEPNSIQVGGEPSGSQSTLFFPGVQDLQGNFSLQISAVMLSVPLTDKISVNLGDHPTAGQALTIDKTIDVAGMPVHFSQAELISGNFGNSLMLKITSDPVETKDGVTPYNIDPGRPEGIQDRYGAGNEDGRLSLHIELIQQTGLEPINGILDIPLVSASILVQGPFNLSFDAASVQELPTPQPPVVAESTFEPLPLGDPLPMGAYRYTGRALQSGDLLSITFDGENSTLYAASPSNSFTPEEVAVLPGEVLAVYASPDHQGIDYLTGDHNTQSADVAYRQLYTLRFGDPAPRLLSGQFETSAYFFNWSFDGRFLAYEVTDDRPGQSFQRYVRILDLSCRISGDCQPFTADTGSQDLFFMSWSPIDYRLALGGTPAEQKFGADDIFLLTLNPDNHQTTLTNLTQSPTINDWAPAQWTPEGNALLFPCETGKEAVNEYSLCRNNLVKGEDEVVTGKLPWNMHSIHLGAGRWVVDAAVVMENGFFSLRSYDLQTGQESTIVKRSVVGKYQVDTAISADGQWLAAYIPEQGGLLALNVLTHTSVTVMPADPNPSFFTWVK